MVNLIGEAVGNRLSHVCGRDLHGAVRLNLPKIGVRSLQTDHQIVDESARVLGILANIDVDAVPGEHLFRFNDVVDRRRVLRFGIRRHLDLNEGRISAAVSVGDFVAQRVGSLNIRRVDDDAAPVNRGRDAGVDLW